MGKGGLNMTKEEFIVIAKGMKSIYSRDKFMVDKEAFDMWYALLKDYDYKDVAMATQNYMSTEKYPPVPADIIDKIHSVSEITTEMTESEAWALVRKAISNAIYHAQEEFEKLPPIIQKVVGSANMLKMWAQTDIDQLETVIQSNFMRSYRAEVSKQREIARMPVEIRNQIEQTKQAMIEG